MDHEIRRKTELRLIVFCFFGSFEDLEQLAQRIDSKCRCFLTKFRFHLYRIFTMSQRENLHAFDSQSAA